MLTRFIFAFTLCISALGGTAYAETLPVPTVEYSADRVMEAKGHTMSGKVYVARDKERMEMSMEGFEMVTILRRDKQLGYLLMPAQHMYREMDLPSALEQSHAQNAEQAEVTKVGSETIDGYATTKYKMVAKDKSAEGFIWVTSEGIPIKMDLLSKEGGATRVIITLSNLKIGAQDPLLFEVPADYQALPKMSIPGLSGVRGALKGLFPGKH